MAQLDASIFMNQQAPDLGRIGEGFERGLRIGDMMRERKAKDAELAKQSKLKDIWNNSTELGEDGQPKFSQNAFLKNLSTQGMNQEAEEYKNKFAQQNSMNIKTNLENMRTQGELVYGAASRSKDQASYERELQGLQQAGVDISQIPKFYDPGLVKQYQYLGMTAKERADADLKLYENRMRQEEMGLRRKDRQDAAQTKAAEREQKRSELSLTQSKQAGNYKIGKIAEEQYSKATSDPDDYDPTSTGQFIDNSGWAPNLVKNKNAIAARNARNSWIETFLRDASGAAIPESEREAYAEIYFPQEGDTQEAVANKAQLRSQKMETAKMAAGKYFADPVGDIPPRSENPNQSSNKPDWAK